MREKGKEEERDKGEKERERGRERAREEKRREGQTGQERKSWQSIITECTVNITTLPCTCVS